MVIAKDIMSTKFLTVQPETPVKDLAKSFSEMSFSGAPVVDSGGALVGIVTESDLIFQHKNLHLPTVITLFDSVLTLGGPHDVEDQIKKMLGYTVADIMSKDVISIDESDTLENIATVMSEEHKHFLPVTKDGDIIGVIDRSALLRAIVQKL